ncbi:integrase core domain protein [Oesophagostomum dentatum]|uniref:Integrase core domain protein n=1 Tax=Oesophagostomum dentatum TaxID=61180 RepID=A0A0B1SZ35_OESDE|nr:integrase core domain protein [Oesophagostomum dentatum]
MATEFAFNLKTSKQKLTRQLNELSALLEESKDYVQPWKFPSDLKEMQLFLVTKPIAVEEICGKIEKLRDSIWNFYTDCNCAIEELENNEETQARGQKLELEFEKYWKEKRGEDTIQIATDICRQLEKRLVELKCQEASLQREIETNSRKGYETKCNINTAEHVNSSMLERRLLGNELKIPDFYGNAADFDSFWELFEELVHKQPYSNIEKLSILVNCCKGDAARAIKMIPRTGDSYAKAVEQLKMQYHDPRRITITMINQLKAMKQCKDDPRNLRNNLNDILAIVETLRKQGETVDTTHLMNIVLETFSKRLQDEVMKKEFDSGKQWNMEELLSNISVAVKRREHLEIRKEDTQTETSVFHTRTSVTVKCTGCGKDHYFRYCPVYRTTDEKIGRLKRISACFKCFSPKHETQFCNKQNCYICKGRHNSILCKRQNYNVKWLPRSPSPRQSSLVRKHSSHEAPTSQTYRRWTCNTRSRSQSFDGKRSMPKGVMRTASRERKHDPCKATAKLFEDGYGLMRCYGRVRASHLLPETLDPIILPTKHPFTALIVNEYHEKCGHQGVNATLANIRLKYWIPKGRQLVRRCLQKCIICKRWNGKPYFYPDSPPLPQSRTRPARPFSHIGIDLAGPFRIVNSEKEHVKRWVLLATCMVTRGIHLEVVNNLSAMQLINGLRRLIARKGKPQLILSDNATNFKLGNEIISTFERKSFNEDETFNTFLTNEMIEWKFITPLSPWKGGFYERMIGLMKSTLRKIMGRKIFNENNFVTLITETEAMVNSRPLTYTGSTPEDTAILRPIDFILPHANLSLPLCKINTSEKDDPDYIPTISTKEEAKLYFSQQLHFLEKLWKIWNENYLLELRNFHQSRIKQKSFTRRVPFLGEVVLLMEETSSRGEWPLGIVVELIKDLDGVIRAVKVRTGKSVLERSINMLIPLEIETNCDNGNKNGKNTLQETGIHKSGDDNGKIEDATHEVTTQPVSDAYRRTRPFLPRKAKENRSHVNYTSISTTTQSTVPRVQWYRWLLVTIVASLCMQSRAENVHQTQLRCKKGGVGISLSSFQDAIEICGNEHCFEVKQPDQNLTIQFPPEITLHTYHVAMKYSERNKTQALHQVCPPSPFCEQITCNFCSAMISNPECWPKIAIGVTAVLVYVVIITSFVTALMIRKLLRLTRTLLVNIWNSLCYGNRKDTRHNSEAVPLLEIDNQRRNRWNASTIIRVLTIVTACITVTKQCQQTIIVPTTVSQCNNEDKNCSSHKMVLAKLNPMQPEMCLKLKHGITLSHFLKITLMEVVLRCRRETLYFTRNTEVHVKHSKRCPHMGTCTGAKCAKITPETLVEELEEANNFTGITYCSESCGGLGCSCGFPSSGCLFYRIYHVPTDGNIYQVFSCPTWFETVKVKYQEFKGNRKTISSVLELKPNAIKHFGSTTLEVTSLSRSPLEILGKRFISNNDATAYIHDETSFSYACVGNPAGNLTCNIKDTCTCNPAEDSVNCYCSQNNVTQFMKLSNSLPIPIPNGVIRTEGINHIPTVRSQDTSAEIAIVFDASVNAVNQEIIEFTCNIIPEEITGCYSCMKGATANVICFSNEPKTTAQVSCSSQEFTLLCSPRGTRNEIKLFFNAAKVNEQCAALCGSKTTIFHLKTTLNYVNGFQPLLSYFRIGGNISESFETFEIKFPDFGHFLDIYKTYLLYTLTVLAAMVFVVVISIIHLASPSMNQPGREEDDDENQLQPEDPELEPDQHIVNIVPDDVRKAACYYCKNAGRTDEMYSHHSAFCPYHFEL